MTQPFLQMVLAVLALAVLLVAWVAVQRAWQQSFAVAGEDDALAARGGCQGCNCHGVCTRAEEDDPVMEDPVNKGERS